MQGQRSDFEIGEALSVPQYGGGGGGGAQDTFSY